MFLNDILYFLWIVYEHRGYAYETAAQVVTMSDNSFLKYLC